MTRTLIPCLEAVPTPHPEPPLLPRRGGIPQRILSPHCAREAPRTDSSVESSPKEPPRGEELTPLRAILDTPWSPPPPRRDRAAGRRCGPLAWLLPRPARARGHLTWRCAGDVSANRAPGARRSAADRAGAPARRGCRCGRPSRLVTCTTSDWRSRPRRSRLSAPDSPRAESRSAAANTRFCLFRPSTSTIQTATRSKSSRPPVDTANANAADPVSPSASPHAGTLVACGSPTGGAEQLIAVDLAGNSKVVARVQSFPFCIDWLPDGRLLIVHSRNRRLLRQEPDGIAGDPRRPEPPLERQLERDRCGWSRQRVCQLRGLRPHGGREVRPGFIALIAPDGSARQVADGIAFPNGMVVTPTTRR